MDAYEQAMPFWQPYAGRSATGRNVRHSLSPLREREFRLLFGARTISFVGSAFANVALAFAVSN